MTHKVLIITSVQKEFQQKVAEQHLPDIEIVAPSEESEIQKHVSSADIIFWNPFTIAKYIQDAESLKWVQSTFAWANALLEPGMKRDYTLTNVKDVFGWHMSEYTFAYILMLEKWVLWNIENQANKHWDRHSYPTVCDKTIAIMGTGSIGKDIAKVAKAFGMKTFGYNTSGKNIEYFDEIFTQKTKKDFFAQADYLVSVLPDTIDTKWIIDKEALSHMKASSVVINIGRWANVVEQDLIEALKNNIVAWAVLDVFQTEPLPQDHAFWELENVFITPHVSGMVEDNSRLIEIFTRNYKKFHAWEPLDYQVSFERWF